MTKQAKHMIGAERCLVWRFLCHFLGVVGALTLLAGIAGATTTSSIKAPRTVFIVTCRCTMAVERARIAKAVRRLGGSIIYTYNSLPGLAVASPKRGDAWRFMARIRHLPTVTDVRVSEAHQLLSMDKPSTETNAGLQVE